MTRAVPSRSLRQFFPSTLACTLVLACALCGGALSDGEVKALEEPTALGTQHKALNAAGLRGLLSKEEAEASVEGQKEFAEHAEGEEGKEGEKAEEGEEGGEEEEEEEFDPADIQVACMLLGSVAFVLTLMWLVNFPDDDVRRYAWRIISATMSIFTAVLFFQGNVQMLELYTEELSPWLQCVIHFSHCLFYCALLAAAIVYISGSANPHDKAELEEESWVIGDAMMATFDTQIDASQVRAVIRDPNTDAKKSVYLDKHGMEVTVVKKQVELAKRQSLMRCWATLLAHMGGFAAIRAGGALQHNFMFSSSPLMAFVAVLLTGAFLVTVFQISEQVREWSYKFRGKATKKGARAKLTRDQVSESENDVMALALSFLTVQVTRFAITGILPNEEGLEPESFRVTSSDILYIMLAGIAFVLTAIAFIILLSKQEESHEGLPTNEGEGATEKPPSAKERLFGSLMNACAMSFAWCIFWGTKWVCMRYEEEFEDAHPHVKPFLDVHSIFGTVVMALILSLITCGVVIFLDKIEDAMKAPGGEQSKVGSQAIQSIISAFGILVGFSWEHCFDEGVAAVASRSQSPAVTKFLMGTACVVILVLPWQKYILSKTMQLEELQRRREEAQVDEKAEKGAAEAAAVK